MRGLRFKESPVQVGVRWSGNQVCLYESGIQWYQLIKRRTYHPGKFLSRHRLHRHDKGLKMDQTKEQLQAEVRYAQRLCQRTSRLYRRVQTTFTFLSILAGSGALVSISAQLPQVWILSSAIAFAAFAAINIAIRPAERVAQNDSDVRKYAALLAKSEGLEVGEIRKLIAEARQSDAPEVEPLRDIAFNDVMREINREDALIPLTPSQKFLGAIA